MLILISKISEKQWFVALKRLLSNVVASSLAFLGVTMFLMDFQKNWDLFSFPFVFPEIPVSLRNLFSQTFRFQPLRQLGAGYYRISASKIARTIQTAVPKSKIYFHGEDLDHSIPGVFDLDFLVLKEREISEKEIWELRSDYFELKRKFPVIGKITFSRNQDFKELQTSGLANLIGFLELKVFSDEGWKSTKLKEVFESIYSSRLALGVYYYQRAQEELIKSFRGNSSFYRAKFFKEIGRAFWVCSGENLSSLQNQSPAILMAHLFYQLQQLADLSNPKVSQEKSDFKILFPEKNGSRFSTEMLNRSWIHKLKRGDSVFASLRASSAPLILIPPSDLNLVSSINLFSGFINLWPPFLQEAKEVPRLIPSKVFEKMSLGWHWGKPFSHLSWACPDQFDDKSWRAECGRATLHRLKERVLLERNLILGKMVTDSPETAFKSLKRLCRNLLVIQANENLPDLLLAERCRKSLPKTSEIFTVLISNKNILSLETVVKASLAVLKETSKV